MEWYEVANVSAIDSPALLIYPERVAANIEEVIRSRGNVQLLRPHVKTNKMPSVVRMMLDRGLTKFKCATIAEAEMLARCGARDVLIAYQVLGPKIERLKSLVTAFPGTRFSALVDDLRIARDQSASFETADLTFNVWIDLDVGQHRTGIPVDQAFALYKQIRKMNGLRVIGLHAYDGHIRDRDYDLRKKRCDEAFVQVESLGERIQSKFGDSLTIVVGGSPSFSVHARRDKVECSPGTFIFWDYGYKHLLQEQNFDYAALVMARVISKMDGRLLCVDLGHKSIASENPFPRVHFLNLPDAIQVGHSEEHLVLDVGDNSAFHLGMVLYGVPLHICPTVALYEEAQVVEDHVVTRQWKVEARDRKLSV